MESNERFRFPVTPILTRTNSTDICAKQLRVLFFGSLKTEQGEIAKAVPSLCPDPSIFCQIGHDRPATVERKNKLNP